MVVPLIGFVVATSLARDDTKQSCRLKSIEGFVDLMPLSTVTKGFP